MLTAPTNTRQSQLKRSIKLCINKLRRKNSSYPFDPTLDQNQLIFIHIPKAAGTSIRHALGLPETGRQHLPWWAYQQADRQKFKTHFKFSFVRHPLDRFLSAYKYLLEGGNKKKDLEVQTAIAQYKCVNDFIEKELINGHLINHDLFRSQSFYLCNWRGEIMVDFLVKHESLDHDFNALSIKLGLHSKLQKLNTSNYQRGALQSDNRTSELIYELYKIDYLTFGYKK